ncbi:MAG: acetate--CoA ligase family protein [Syntrophorhabdaceae bacterium]|nr:acetate--CoA ligase family protein [Syntrophorhabdaceae bacterium]
MDTEVKGSFLQYKALFMPDSIVIVGASEDTNKPGGKILKNIIDHRYEGRLMVVNPKGNKVLGIDSYPSLKELPEIPELAIIVVPAKAVIAVFEEMAEIGVKAVIIISAGFGEKDKEGKKKEAHLLKIANENGIIMIGPNCSGFMTPYYSGKFAGIMPETKPGAIDLISGSGAFVDLVMEQAVSRGLSFSNVVNVGNSVQIGIEDLIGLYGEHYEIGGAPILMMYIESLKKPREFLSHTKRLVEKGCSIIAIKSGATDAGVRAAISHTGAMANNDTVVDTLFKKAGIIRAESKIEMIDIACVLKAIRGKFKGNHVCVITDAGGPGVIITDELERQGFKVPVLREDTQNIIGKILPPECSVLNPIDCFPSRTATQIKEILKILNEEEKDNIDVIVVMIANPGFFDNKKIYDEIAIAIKYSTIPIIPVFSSVTTCHRPLMEFASQGNFYFFDEVNLAKAMGKVLRKPKIYKKSNEVFHYDKNAVKDIIDKRGILSFSDVSKILGYLRFKMPLQVYMTSKKDVYSACEKIGFPMVMKAIGPIHKTETNGVRVGIDSQEKALSIWEELIKIEGAIAVLAQQLVVGNEIIIGCKRDDTSGHLIMFGLGGIYTEALKDMVFNMAPLTKEEAYDMITNIRGFSLIKGIRGQKGMSIEILTDYLVRIGRLVEDFPDISEIDINPIKGEGDDLYAVDARIVISPQ